MEREIIFRGKRVDNGEWVEGYYAKINTDRSIDVFYHEIFTGEMASDNSGRVNFKRYIVKTETVGQYTGLKDHKGNMIFDGDVLVGYNTYNFKVCIENGHTFIKWVDDGERISEYLGCIYIKENDVEVIGNIHDNPELLEV